MGNADGAHGVHDADGADGPDRGPVALGAQRERTRLAWSRTALSFIALGGLLLHTGRTAQAVLGTVPGSVVIAYGVLIYLTGRLRYRRATGYASEPPAVGSNVSLGVVSLLCSLAALMGLAMTVSLAISRLR